MLSNQVVSAVETVLGHYFTGSKAYSDVINATGVDPESVDGGTFNDCTVPAYEL